MLEYSHGEIGWDVFTLEYKVDAPIDTVLDPESMMKYLKIFHHLWRMKRVESALSQGWMRIAGASRTFLRLHGMLYCMSCSIGLWLINRVDFDHDWHQIRIVMAEMIHFVRQMQAYCHIEVIECSWKSLTEFFQKREGDLDSMIEAHRSYLDKMVKKVLLLGTKVGKEVCPRYLLYNLVHCIPQEALLMQVQEAFATVLQFREATVSVARCYKGHSCNPS